MKTVQLYTNDTQGLQLKLNDGYYNHISITDHTGETFVRRYNLLPSINAGFFEFKAIKYRLTASLHDQLFRDWMGEEQSKATRTVEIQFDSNSNKEDIPAPAYNPDTKVKHAKYDTIKTCVEEDIPVYLYGEAGTGKNYTLQEIAEDLNLEFYFTNSVQQEYKITGFIDAGGHYHETEFYKAFTLGGLFFLDEIDASIPEVLVLLNAAIANKYFEFPNGRVNAHPDFRVVAAGNTVGSGADELYTGRLVLDAATLDRFVAIEFDYDEGVELMLAQGNTKLVNFIRSLRQNAKETGIRATFSYRTIITVTKLEKAGMGLKEILKIAVLKGMDKDTINTLKTSDAGKYYYALKELQQAS